MYGMRSPSLSPLVKKGTAMAKAQSTVLRNDGVLPFLRTTPDAILEFLGFILLDSRALLMNSAEVNQRWAERSGDYSPDFYAELGPDEGSESIRVVLDEHVESDAAILELGCSVGRHLSHLHDEGYTNLHGIEINQSALATMERTYPGLAADGTFYLDAMETILPQFEDGQFDVVYSYETLELLHPDIEWIFAELVRITNGLLITVENEGEDEYATVEFAVEDLDNFPIYYRKYNRIFTDLGLEEIFSMEQDMDTLRVFRKRQ
jgi:SAM-dependent methyltransferase